MQPCIVFKKADGICGNVIQSPARRQQSPLAEKEIMANVSKLIFGAAIAAASIANPALAAHKGKPISAHQNGYVTRSSQGSGVYDLYDPGTESPQCQSRNPSPSCPYHYVPGSRSGGQ